MMGRAMPSGCVDTIFIHKNVKCLFDGAAHADWNEWDNPTFLTLTRTELTRRARDRAALPNRQLPEMWGRRAPGFDVRNG